MEDLSIRLCVHISACPRVLKFKQSDCLTAKLLKLQSWDWSQMKKEKNRTSTNSLVLMVTDGRTDIRTDIRTDERTDGHMDGRTDIWTDGRKDRRMDGRTDIWTDRPSYRDARTHLKTYY